MRQRLASLTGNETRLIGGSSDTIYFPRESCVHHGLTILFISIADRYSALMKDTLGLFLQTNCFLEIALPTVVHLIVHPKDHIQFVDHVCIFSLRCRLIPFIILFKKWWIYKPPFNATFVRQQWELGYEVDTFHTYVCPDPVAYS